MKKINPLIVITLLLVSVLFSSCEVIEGIFKAGMGFGIFIVIAVIVLIVGIIFKLGKRN
ncbi:hypothetical protein [Flavobacterium granuli]|uniref:Phosphatidate cytidylyltransferase n=1 Tax=Flavobacterium granuli TaxID=280093 RepID=A0ABU1S0J8_9FLAO|nr:hypothetical protein [Flavobacterium granuli]MDR6843679.1 hypothetical protein [Flavobacterium granuli]